MSAPRHVPVLVDRVVELVTPALSEPGAVMVDATLGLGGHAEAVLSALPEVRVIGIDRDPAALVRARERLAAYGDRLVTAEAVYDEVASVLAQTGTPRVGAVLFDLGVSSMQLDEVERGFSYAREAPLDMRMGDVGPTAADVLNSYSQSDLERLLRIYGEERFSRRIAAAIVDRRGAAPLRTSVELVEIVRESIPAPARRTGGNPAKRTFQALRIEVNDELEVLRRAIPASLETVAVGGRVVAMAYHSLEDRIVKRAFAEVTTTDVPPDLPVVPTELRPRFQLVTRGAERASDEEITRNGRARSVRLRAVERTREVA